MRRSSGAVAVALVLAIVTTLSACAQPTVVPPVVGDPGRGAELFDASCASCHGVGAVGTDQGPSFLDPIYRPGHHADASFLLAVQQGVQPHHWTFGPMPAVPGLTETDVRDIVAYVRQLQTAAGIE